MSEYLITFSPAEIEAIRAKWQDKALGHKALTDAECDGGIDLCRRYGAHPLRNQMIPMKFFDREQKQSTLTWITSIDMMRLGAHRTGLFAGMDDFEREYNDQGSLIGCSTHIYRMVQGQRCAFPGVAVWDELFSEKGLMAKKMPLTWIDKCAEASGLRRAFPLECGNLYLREEIKHASIDGGEDDGGPPPPTARAVPTEPTTANGRDSGERNPNAEKPAPAKPKSWTRDMLIAMVGEWAKVAPELQLDITKGLIEAKGLKGVKPSEARFQDFCAAVAEAIDRCETIERFAGLPEPETEPEPVRAPAAASAVEEF